MSAYLESDDFRRPEDGDDATSSIQRIMDDVWSKGGGTARVSAGVKPVYGTITPRPGVRLMGAHKYGTTLRRMTPGHTIGKYGLDVLRGFDLSEMTLDSNFTPSPGAWFEGTDDISVERVCLLNGSVWGLVFGTSVNGGKDNGIRNGKVTCRDISADNFSSTYEQILVFNTEDYFQERCDFANTTGIGLGLYQFVRRARVRSSSYKNCNRGVYYALSCDNIDIEADFDGGMIGVQGANVSDHGAFGYTYSRNLRIKGSFRGMVSGAELGAVRNATLEGSLFEDCLASGARIFRGNLAPDMNAVPASLTVSNTTFRNNNRSNGAGVSHPGLLIQGPVGELNVDDARFYDDQPAHTQLYPIVFGGGASSGVNITRSLLAAYGGSGGNGQSIGLVDGATVASGRVRDCWGLSNLPAGFVGA